MRIPDFNIKKLDIFIIKSFTQLLLGTFFICLFIFIMQFLWRWVDELVGKGLDFEVLAQFFYLSSLMLVGQALPLAILLAALMTFGNFGERLELLAMKAAGIPLVRIMVPLVFECIILAGFSFYFQNNIAPKAQVKLYTVLYSIKQTSPEVEIPEGAFYDQIEGYNLFVKKKNKETGMLYNVMIYDLSAGFENTRILIADSGRIDTTDDHKYMMITLMSGELFENLKTEDIRRQNHPYRRETYTKKVIAVDFDGGFNMQDASFLNSQAASKNMGQLSHSIDSLVQYNDSVGRSNWKAVMKSAYPLKPVFTKEDSMHIDKDKLYTINIDSIFKSASKSDKQRWIKSELNKVQQIKTDFEIKKNIMRSLDKDLNNHKLMWWDKIILALACIIFFFIGAPMGAIVRKGGLGYPVLISVATFVLYYVFNTSGYKMAREGEWYVWVGSWLSTMILAPIGIVLTLQSNRDSTIMNTDAYKAFFRKLFGIREERHVTLKEVVIDDPDYRKDADILDNILDKAVKIKDNSNLKHCPTIKSVFFSKYNENRAKELSEQLESVVEELGNSRNKKIIGSLNAFPIMAADGIYSPLKKHWLNILSLILFPVGIMIYLRSWMYRFRLLKDLIKVERTSRLILEIMIKENLL